MYEIGQIIFCIPQGRTTVFAARVIEERVVRRKNNVDRTWIVERTGADGKFTSVDLSEFRCETFSNEKQMRKVLMKRATDALSSLLDDVVKRANEDFGRLDVETNPHPKHFDDVVEGDGDIDDHVNVQLPDGSIVKANVKLPDGTTMKVNA